MGGVACVGKLGGNFFFALCLLAAFNPILPPLLLTLPYTGRFLPPHELFSVPLKQIRGREGRPSAEFLLERDEIAIVSSTGLGPGGASDGVVGCMRVS